MKHNALNSEELRRQKKHVRAAALRDRNLLSTPVRQHKSRQIIDRLAAMTSEMQARCWFIYVSFGSEVQTHDLIVRLLAAGNHVCVPAVDTHAQVMHACRITGFERDIAPGYSGILEPPPGRRVLVEKQMIDLVIVPGAAFSDDCFRIGYGGGYYDRFLKDCRAVSIGLAFNQQIFREIPHDADHDIDLDFIVTESRVMRNPQAGGARR